MDDGGFEGVIDEAAGAGWRGRARELFEAMAGMMWAVVSFWENRDEDSQKLTKCYEDAAEEQQDSCDVIPCVILIEIGDESNFHRPTEYDVNAIRGSGTVDDYKANVLIFQDMHVVTQHREYLIVTYLGTLWICVRFFTRPQWAGQCESNTRSTNNTDREYVKLAPIWTFDGSWDRRCKTRSVQGQKRHIRTLAKTWPTRHPSCDTSQERKPEIQRQLPI